MNEELLMISEAFNTLYVDDEECVVATEGTMSELDKMKASFSKPFKEASKACNKAIRKKDFKEARKQLNEMKKLVDKLDSDFRNIPEGSMTETIACTVVTMLYRDIFVGGIAVITMSLGILLASAGTVAAVSDEKKSTTGAAVAAAGGLLTGAGAGIASIEPLANILSTVKHIWKSDKEGNDKYNELLHWWADYIKRAKARLDAVEKKIDKAEAKVKKAEKDEKTVKESVAFKAAKLALYEACSNGEITVEEREDLIQDLNDKFYIKEQVEFSDNKEDDSEETTSDEPAEFAEMTAIEKFNAAKLALYEACDEGKIDVEERERLIGVARDMYK